MAGILAIYKKSDMDEEILDILREGAFKLKHRGENHKFVHKQSPTELIFYQKQKCDRNTPLNFALDDESNNFIVIDGQIYNLKEINTRYLNNHGGSRVEKNKNLEGVIAGYKKCGIKLFKQLIGSFSGVLYNGEELIGFKDPVGGKPLYYSDTNDFFVMSSELKALAPLNINISSVKPGSIRFSSGHNKRYHHFPKFIKKYRLTRRTTNKYAKELNETVKLAVADNIREGEKISALLSGGLDSTIITNIAKDLVESLNVYTVGVKGSRDILYANKFAKRYDLNHTVVKIKLNDMLECLPDVIFALETFDAALIRSSVPMFLIAKKIREMEGSCVLLTGEGGDELFGGYSYLLDYDSNESFNQELLYLLEVEHSTGLQRVDRIPYFFSIEARAPLFDQRIVELSFKIPPELKIFRKKGLGIAKKWILRKAFEHEMPSEFIWRKKQKFSYGAGSQFILRDHINEIISDKEFHDERQISPVFKLRSKEELYYWRIFKSRFEPTLETLSDIGTTSVFEI